jgi:hypothetical protein
VSGSVLRQSTEASHTGRAGVERIHERRGRASHGSQRSASARDTGAVADIGARQVDRLFSERGSNSLYLSSTLDVLRQVVKIIVDRKPVNVHSIQLVEHRTLGLGQNFEFADRNIVPGFPSCAYAE